LLSAEVNARVRARTGAPKGADGSRLSQHHAVLGDARERAVRVAVLHGLDRLPPHVDVVQLVRLGKRCKRLFGPDIGGVRADALVRTLKPDHEIRHCHAS